MSSASDKIREKLLMQSISSRDIDSFMLLYSEIIEDQYKSLVESRFFEQIGLNNVKD